MNRFSRLFAIFFLFLTGYFGTAVAAPFVYVANRADATVSKIDAATRSVIATIPVGETPFQITANAKKVVVTDQQAPFLHLIDIASNLVESINIETANGLGATARGIALSPNGKKAYVVDGDGNGIIVVNLVTRTVEDSVLMQGAGLFDISVTPDGSKAYTTSLTHDGVIVIHLNQSPPQPGTFIREGNLPIGIAITKNGSLACEANYIEQTVGIIDAEDESVVTTLYVGPQPQYIAIAPNSKRAYITTPADDVVYRINLKKRKTLDPIPLNTIAPNSYFSEGIAITPNGSTLYVSLSNPADQTLPGIVIPIDISDPQEPIVQAPIIVGAFPLGITVAPLK
jgi:YVTN family beta-propeller protein